MPLSLLRSNRRLHVQLRVWLLLGVDDRVLACTGQILQNDPEDVHAWATRAHVLAAQKQSAAALQALQELTRLSPLQASAWFNLGFVSEDMGLLAQAEQAFERALQLNPAMDRAWYGLALCLMRQSRWQQAVLALKKNTELQPLSPHGWYQLARAYLALQQLDEAQAVISHLRHFEPKVAAQLQQEMGLAWPLAVQAPCAEKTSGALRANG